MFLLLIVGNMRNMQYNMQQYAKYVNTISICRICTPHFAEVCNLRILSTCHGARNNDPTPPMPQPVTKAD